MRAGGIAAAALAVAALAGCHKQNDAPAGQAGTLDPAHPTGWLAALAETPEGGVRMGNPKAPVQLIEYASYTCPHCAAFAAESGPTIRQWVASGKLGYELRNFVRDPFDLSAALVARCGGPGSFFPISNQIFASQQEWIGNAQNMTPDDAKKIGALPPGEQMYQMTRVTGLNAYAGARGVTPDKLHACLADQSAWTKLTGYAQAGAQKYHIDGTPTFILNGKVMGSPDWQGLEPDLKRAVGA